MLYRNYRGRTLKKQKNCLGNLLWCLEQLVNNSLQFFYLIITYYLNTFCKTLLIVSKLNTLKLNTKINRSHLCQIETAIEMNTLSDKQQHTSLLYIKHCSLSCSLFLFSSTESTFSQQPKKSNIQYCTLLNCTLQCSKFSLCKNKPKMCILYCNWIDLTSMSPQACSIACRRGMRACGLQPSLSQKIIFYRVWKWRVRGYMTSNWLWLTNHFRTRTVWYKLTLSETTFSQGPFFHFSMMVQ